MSRAALQFAVLAAACAAQAGEVAATCDGSPGEGLSSEGAASVVTESSRVKIGRAAFRVAPSEGVKFYGATVPNVPTKGAGLAVFVLFLEGDRPRDFRIRLGDAASDRVQKTSFVEYRTLKPGWNEVAVDLRARTAGDGRVLDFGAAIKEAQISKKVEAGDPAVIVDGVLLRDLPGGESATADKAAEKKLAAQIADEKDGGKRAKLFRDGAGALIETSRVAVALRLLREDEHPGVRREAREALARVSSPAAVAALTLALKSLAGDARIEASWALAAGASAEARGAAFEAARHPKAAVPERTALINGLAKKNMADVAALADACTAHGPWPPRAALVRALRVAAVKESVDALIDILAEPGSTRVAEDAEAALVALTGQDLGDQASRWRDWWTVQRERAKVGGHASRGPSGYATFYGIAVPKGRMAFVVDASGSMREEARGAKIDEYKAKAKHLAGLEPKTRLDFAKAELMHALEGTKDGSYAGVVAFSNDKQWVSDGLERLDPVLREKLVKRVKSLSIGGKTNIYAGLRAAFHPSGEPAERDWAEGPDTLFLLSDGAPSAGLYDRRDELRDEILRWNLGRAVKIHCVNLGDADVQMLRAWTDSSGGTLLDLRSERAAPAPPKRP
jgi:hypothetical protein